VHFLVRKIVAANKQAPLPRVPIEKFEVTTSKCVMIVIMKSLTLTYCLFLEGTHTRQAMARSNTTHTKILYDHPLIWKSHWTPEYVNK
jgi:hypothetical protein